MKYLENFSDRLFVMRLGARLAVVLGAFLFIYSIFAPKRREIISTDASVPAE